MSIEKERRETVHAGFGKFSIPIGLAAPRHEDHEGLRALLDGTAWDVQSFASGEEACARYRAAENPILLWDIEAEARPWRESIQRLRARRKDACVILLADPDRVREDEASGAGVFDLLIRPFSREDALRTLLFAYSHCRANWPARSLRRTFHPASYARLHV